MSSHEEIVYNKCYFNGYLRLQINQIEIIPQRKSSYNSRYYCSYQVIKVKIQSLKFETSPVNNTRRLPEGSYVSIKIKLNNHLVALCNLPEKIWKAMLWKLRRSVSVINTGLLRSKDESPSESKFNQKKIKYQELH